MSMLFQNTFCSSYPDLVFIFHVYLAEDCDLHGTSHPSTSYLPLHSHSYNCNFSVFVMLYAQVNALQRIPF